MRKAVLLEPLLEFNYPSDMPEAPPYIHKRALLESEAVGDNEPTVANLQKVFGIEDDDARNVVSSLE